MVFRFRLRRSYSLPYADCDLIAWPLDVVQEHGDLGSWRNAARDNDVDLVQPHESWSISEPQNLGQAAADGDLRRDDGPVQQASAIDRQCFSRDGGVGGRGDPKR